MYYDYYAPLDRHIVFVVLVRPSAELSISLRLFCQRSYHNDWTLQKRYLCVWNIIICMRWKNNGENDTKYLTDFLKNNVNEFVRVVTPALFSRLTLFWKRPLAPKVLVCHGQLSSICCKKNKSKKKKIIMCLCPLGTFCHSLYRRAFVRETAGHVSSFLKVWIKLSLVRFKMAFFSGLLPYAKRDLPLFGKIKDRPVLSGPQCKINWKELVH